MCELVDGSLRLHQLTHFGVRDAEDEVVRVEMVAAAPPS